MVDQTSAQLQPRGVYVADARPRKWESTWVTGTRQTFNYFNVGDQLWFPLRIRVTSVAGDVVDGLIMGGHAEEELDGQFPACK